MQLLRADCSQSAAGAMPVGSASPKGDVTLMDDTSVRKLRPMRRALKSASLRRLSKGVRPLANE